MTAENRSRDGGNVWMIVLIALALIATVIMLFSDSAVWLQIALLAALWSAICGFLLVTRTRNDRDRARAELDAREREYQAELEALRARNDADRHALEAARAGEGLPPAVDTEVLREIRAELATLRAQLEDLSGREFGYEPAALQAEARRVKEIEARASRVAPQPQQPARDPQAAAQPAQPQRAAQPQPAHQPQREQQAPQPQSRPQQRPQQPVQPTPQPAQPQRPEPSRQQPQQAQPKPAPAPEKPKQWPEQPQRGESTRWSAPNDKEVTSRIKPVRDADEDQAINALTKQPGQQQAEQQPQQPQQRPAAQDQPQQQPHVHRGPSSDAVAGRVGSHRAPEGRNPLTDLIRERQEELDRERELQQRQQQEAQQRRERRVEQKRREEQRRREEEARRAKEARRAEEAHKAEEARKAEQARQAEAEQEADSRGRRRADENREGALTVAELLARSKKGQ